MSVVSMNYLLEAGVQFGHQKRRWNPKMKQYIYTSRDDIYIIDLQKAVKCLEDAYEAMKEIASNGGQVLFIGTKKQAQEAAKECAERVGMYYVNTRWLGGTLTNFRTIRSRVTRMEEIEKQEEDGTFEALPKKEVIKIRKEYAKLVSNLSGIRNMTKLPQALVIVDPKKEENAIKEARILGIPVFGIVDTNCDPDMVDYVIPANDDAIRAVKLITGVMANAIVEANGGEIVDYVSDKANNENAAEVMQKALETVKRKDERPKEFTKKENFKKPFKKETKKEFVKKEEAKEEKAVKEEVKETKKANVDLESKTVAELRELAKAKDVKGYSTMKKAELLEALK